MASRFIFLFFQYIITFCLVVAAIYLSRQLYFLLHTDVGYQTENVIQCRFWRENPSIYSMSPEEYDKEMAKNKSVCALVEQRLKESPLLTGFAYGEPPYQLNWELKFSTEQGETAEVLWMMTDKELMDLFGFQVVEGRTWNEEDELTQYKLIANRAFLNALHITDWKSTKVTPDRRLWWSSVAASLLLLVGLGFGIAEIRQDALATTPQDTFTNPEDAHRALQAIFTEMSRNWNEGMEQLEASQQDIMAASRGIREEFE